MLVVGILVVRSASGAAMRLMADANESYQPKAAIRMIHKIVDYGIELIEQPT